MKKSIWKFELAVTDEQAIQMPEGAEIISCELQNQQICLWAIVTIDNTLIERHFEIYGTGNPADTIRGHTHKFINTILGMGGLAAWHVFEVVHLKAPSIEYSDSGE